MNKIVKLYVKCHTTTNLQYFGRTIKEDVDKYRGSGSYWVNHIKKHGSKLDSMIIAEYEENDPMLIEYALGFSAANDIVGSTNWANQIPEQGTHLSDTTGYAPMKDVNGSIHFVSLSDSRILSGELVGITRGKAVVKDIDGVAYSIDVDDPRILSGELVGVNSGVSMSDSMKASLKDSLSSKHPSSKIIKIFNKKGDFVFHSERNFAKLCIVMNMPHNEFLKSIAAAGSYKVYDKIYKSAEKRHIMLNRELYRGWSAVDEGSRYMITDEDILQFYNHL